MSTSSIDCDMASTENKINVFAQRLKESRLKADISRAELSRRTGISEITLSSYEISDSLKKPTLGKVVPESVKLGF